MFLEGLLGGLEHRLVELLGELLGREAVPGLGAAVEAGGPLFGLHGERGRQAAQQVAAPLGRGAPLDASPPPGLVRVDGRRQGFLWS